MSFNPLDISDGFSTELEKLTLILLQLTKEMRRLETKFIEQELEIVQLRGLIEEMVLKK